MPVRSRVTVGAVKAARQGVGRGGRRGSCSDGRCAVGDLRRGHSDTDSARPLDDLRRPAVCLRDLGDDDAGSSVRHGALREGGGRIATAARRHSATTARSVGGWLDERRGLGADRADDRVGEGARRDADGSRAAAGRCKPSSSVGQSAGVQALCPCVPIVLAQPRRLLSCRHGPELIVIVSDIRARA
jgi:hypothetical protein